MLIIPIVSAFLKKFYSQILARKQPEKNLAVFTINISKLLGMLANGAKGNTSKEIKKAMNLSNDDETMRAGFQNLDQFLSSVSHL